MDDLECLPTLYVLMRNDMDSMNCGKAIAQGHHCGSVFAKNMEDSKNLLYNNWLQETLQGFGTVLVLGVDETQMRNAIHAGLTCGFPSGLVNDTSYPLRDGGVTHYLNIDTCGYIFGNKNNPILKSILKGLEPHA
jgi:peptidyl-tRNA hydrolase